MSAILLLLMIALTAANDEVYGTCDRPLDLAFVVDSSTTVCGNTQPCERWLDILQFCAQIVDSMTIGFSDTKVAFATIGDHVELQWNFNKYTDKTELIEAIANVTFSGGELREPITIAKFITQIFNPAPVIGTDRPQIQNIAILFTDGVPDMPDFIYALDSDLIQATRNVGMFVICITPGCTEQCAHDVSSPPQKANETYFLASDYLYIDQFRDLLVEKFCAYKFRVVSG